MGNFIYRLACPGFKPVTELSESMIILDAYTALVGDGIQITTWPSRLTSADMRAKRLLDTSWTCLPGLPTLIQITEGVSS